MTAIRRFPPAFLAIAMVLTSCAPGAGSSAPSASSSLPAGSPESPTGSSVSSVAPVAGQTDTEWGRIWDTLPPRFPTYPNGVPDEEAGGGPASAVIVIDGLSAADAATFLQTLLQRAGYTTVGSLEPLEDGSVVLDMTGAPEGCMLRATATPTGDVTTVRILYGAECPFE